MPRPRLVARNAAVGVLLSYHAMEYCYICDQRPGASLLASHCIIQSIGRSGIEAEHGGIVELRSCVVQVRSRVTVRCRQLCTCSLSAHSDGTGVRAALCIGCSWWSYKLSRLQVHLIPFFAAAAAVFDPDMRALICLPQLLQVRVQRCCLQPRGRSSGCKQR